MDLSKEWCLLQRPVMPVIVYGCSRRMTTYSMLLAFDREH